MTPPSNNTPPPARVIGRSRPVLGGPLSGAQIRDRPRVQAHPSKARSPEGGIPLLLLELCPEQVAQRPEALALPARRRLGEVRLRLRPLGSLLGSDLGEAQPALLVDRGDQGGGDV